MTDSDLLQFCPKQKAYVKCWKMDSDTSFQAARKAGWRETREKILEERK